jgi:hypothetical protein
MSQRPRSGMPRSAIVGDTRGVMKFVITPRPTKSLALHCYASILPNWSIWSHLPSVTGSPQANWPTPSMPTPRRRRRSEKSSLDDNTPGSLIYPSARARWHQLAGPVNVTKTSGRQPVKGFSVETWLVNSTS